MASGEEEEALKSVKGNRGARKSKKKSKNATSKEKGGKKSGREGSTKGDTKTPKQTTKAVRWEDERGYDFGSDSANEDGDVEMVQEKQDEVSDSHKDKKTKTPPTGKPRHVQAATGLRNQNIRDGVWVDHEYTHDSGEEGCGELEEGQVSQNVLKYRGIVSAYLKYTGIYDLSSHGALERIMSATGYDFDEQEKEELLVMIHSMVSLHIKNVAEADEEKQPIGDVAVLWYSSKLQERKKMVERLTKLRHERLTEEKRDNKKKKKRAEKKGREFKGETNSVTIRDECETEEDPAFFASGLIDGFTDSFEGVEFYYPPVEDLSDSELLEETPVPASSRQMLTEEMNLAEMIRDSYKVSVDMLRREMGKKGDLKELFQKWISQARSKWKELDSHPEYIKAVDEFLREEKTHLGLELEGEEAYQFDQVVFSIPTDARNKTLEWFERDWGLKKAATQNHQLCEKFFGKRQPLKPVPVYLVNSEFDEKEEDPGLQEMFTSGTKKVDVDVKNHDPFSRKTYYVSDEVYDFTGSRLMRHRDVIYDIFQYLKKRYLKSVKKSDNKDLLFNDTFLICSEKLQKIFHEFPSDTYISWSQASDFLLRNHLWNIPGPAIRPADPLFYPDNAHKAYRHLPTLLRAARGSQYQRPHQAATFTAVAPTGEVWRRHSSKVCGFRDSHKWEYGFKRWAGPELLMSSPQYTRYPSEKKQAFIDKFHRLSEEEKNGECSPWWLYTSDERGKWKMDMLTKAKNPTDEDEVDSIANNFQPTWYGEWRRPWQRNLGYTAEEMLNELQVLRDIAEEQEEGLVDTRDGWKRKRESSLLESDFYPSVCTKPVKADGAEHFMNPEMSGTEAEDVPWDQTLFTNVAWRLYGKEPERPVKKRKTFSRTTWWHPDRQRALDGYHLENLYGKYPRGFNTLDVQDPRQVYMCWSDDEEDRREQMKEQDRERKLGEKRHFQESLPQVVEVSDGEQGGSEEPEVEEVEEDTDEGSEEEEPGYDFGPTIEEIDE